MATACTEQKSTRSDRSGANRENSDRYTGSSVLTNEVTNTRSPRAARYLARCSASTVFPVPAAPRIRAGPDQCRLICSAWVGCSQVIQVSTGSRAAAASSSDHTCSRLTSASGSAGANGSTSGADTGGGGIGGRDIGGQARTRTSTSRSTTSGGSRTPRRIRSRVRSRSPVTSTRPSTPRALRRPASTSNGTTSVGGRPSAASSVSTVSAWCSSVRTSSSTSASPRHSRSPSSRTSRQALTSTTKTPPGPTSSTSILARRVPGQRRSGSTCQPAVVHADQHPDDVELALATDPPVPLLPTQGAQGGGELDDLALDRLDLQAEQHGLAERGIALGGVHRRPFQARSGFDHKSGGQPVSSARRLDAPLTTSISSVPMAFSSSPAAGNA